MEFIVTHYKRRDCIDGFAFILPAFIIIFTFVIYPSLRLFFLSFHDANLMGGVKFAGLKNFRNLIGSQDFIRSFAVTLRFMAMVIAVQTLIAFIGALIVSESTKGASLVRTIFFIPVIISFVVVGYLWQGMYNHDYGLVNSLLSLLGFKRIGFLSDPAYALYALTATCIWKSWPYFMMIFLAGLKEIPTELYESAMIDGASELRRLVAITIPLLRRTTLFILLITTMDSVVKVFTPVFVMTSGGPRGSTDLLVHYAWRMAFRFGEVGYASSIMVFVFIFLMVVSFIQLKIGDRNEK